ncbi:MAG: small subunit ribosomal protein [Thermotogaceae bacterium]|nr:small subunit ribosomal protein [Thermotogaceae bacterium]MDN5338452.1 small subunit ribosomal protein [Thermotogaceae bacterium]
MERIYETMFIVVPSLNDEEREAVVEKVKNFIQERLEGKIENVDRWGIRKLAFKVKKFTEGDYTVIIFRASPEKVNELENFYHITQEIFRWQTFRREDLEKKEKKRKEKEGNVEVKENVPASETSEEVVVSESENAEESQE